VALFSSLTDFGKAHPRLDLAYRRFGAGTTIVLMAASFLGRYYDVAATGQAAILVIVVANTVGAIHMAFRRIRTALLYLLAFGPYLAAALFRLGRTLGWAPTDFMAVHGLQVAAIFHFCLMNLPLAEHMARIRRERDEALQAALQVKEDIQRRLEEVVEARTCELREEQARTQQALERERQVVAEQGQFLSMVSHEFRTPLAVIDGAAQIARLTAAEDPQEVEHRMGTVQRSVRRLLHLLDTWIIQDRITSRRLEMRTEPIDLADLMTDLAQQTREAAPDREILLSLDPGLPRIDGDPSMLATALHNLLDNALKYSPEGSQVHLRALLRAPWIRLEVEDHGQGIPADQAQTVRSRYVRGRNAGRTPGLGLGLHLVETIVGRHGGRFDLESAEGRGALARISLPCGKPTAMQSPSSPIP